MLVGKSTVMSSFKCLSSQSYGFSSGHVWMWELDYKESWAPKNWYFWTVVLKKTVESPLDCKEIESVNPKGNHSWIFIRRTDAEATMYWPLDAQSRFTRKETDTAKDWRQRKKGMTEDKMVGCHHQLNGQELSKLWEIEGQGCLPCCRSCCHKDLNRTEQLNNNKVCKWGLPW